MLILNIYHILNRSMEYQIKLVMFRLYQKVKIIYFSVDILMNIKFMVCRSVIIIGMHLAQLYLFEVLFGLGIH